MANKCFYHSKDHDGECSAAIIYSKYPDCKLIGVDYDEEFPTGIINYGDRIFMVDYSRPQWEEMLNIQNFCEEFIWIDHHKAIIEKMNKSDNRLKKYYVSTDKAACELCWEYFYKTEVPVGVRLLGQYDRWDHSDPKAIPFEVGLRGYDTSPEKEIWKKVFKSNDYFIDDIIKKGKLIKEYQDKADKWNMKKSFPFKWEGVSFICIDNVNTGSLQFDSVWDPEKYDAVLVFYLGTDFMWNIRMYTSKEGIDLSKIAVKYGGGGHTNACGCKIKNLPFFGQGLI